MTTHQFNNQTSSLRFQVLFLCLRVVTVVFIFLGKEVGGKEGFTIQQSFEIKLVHFIACYSTLSFDQLIKLIMKPFLPHGAWKHLIYYQSATNKGCINNCLSISVVQCRFHLDSSIIIFLFRQPLLNHCASFLLVLPNTSRIYYITLPIPSFWKVYRTSLNNIWGRLLLFSHNYSREGNYFREAIILNIAHWKSSTKYFVLFSH